MQHQDSLPSMDNVAASNLCDSSRVPSYRGTRRYRFHPYKRLIPVLVNEEDSLPNSIHDHERVMLNVPLLPTGRAVTHPPVPQAIDEFEERLRQSVERVFAFELHVPRLSTVIVDFVASITRGTRD